VRILVALTGDDALDVAADLRHAGHEAVLTSLQEVSLDGELGLAAADILVVESSRAVLTSQLIAMCDRAAVRIVPRARTAADARFARSLGLDPVASSDAATILDPSVADADHAMAGSVFVVWGPQGAPGRTTVALSLAAELARGDRHVAVIDADVQAPSVAIALGIPDEGPGFAAACRSAGRAELDIAELSRIAVEVDVRDGRLDVLTGLNRVGRWPELSDARVTEALQVARTWADFVIVDVSSSLERDEELITDLDDAPRRNAATLAALRAADRIIVVLSADPVGVARFLRAFPDLRESIGDTPIEVVANRVRRSVLGVDPRGQLQRSLHRFAGIGEFHALPDDPVAADAALLHARPVSDQAPRSGLAAGIRRLAGHLAPVPLETPTGSRSRAGGRWLRHPIGRSTSDDGFADARMARGMAQSADSASPGEMPGDVETTSRDRRVG